VLALITGILLAALWFLRPTSSPVAATIQIVTRSVLIAMHPIPAGTLLRQSDIGWGDVPPPQFSDLNIANAGGADTAFLGAVTRRAFATHEPLITSALVKPGDRDFLVTILGPGYRAISIAVDATQSTSGLVRPGDFVDVLLTQNFASQGTDAGHKSVGETVLRGLRVIAVDQELTAAGKPEGTPLNEPKMPKTITLEVTEKQAAALLVAEQLGKIDLALRGRQDQDAMPATAYPEISPTWASDVSQALGRGPSPTASKRTSDSIVVIRGAKIEKLCKTTTGLLACP
jgi:pilus assembly protein CpaB